MKKTIHNDIREYWKDVLGRAVAKMPEEKLVQAYELFQQPNTAFELTITREGTALQVIERPKDPNTLIAEKLIADHAKTRTKTKAKRGKTP